MESRFYLTRPNFRQTNSKVRAPEYLFSPITGIVRYAFFSRKIISVVSFSAMFFTGKLTRKFGSDKNFEKSQVGEARIRGNTCHNEVFLSSAFGYGASAAVRRRCCSHWRPYARCNERERDKERKVDRPSDFQFGLHELETVCA